ncbi:phospho-sugar mutase [Sphingobacterium hotanense]|uniref:Phospho-sugar mutase n=1 Tax=Sphingobacterium hotanense TaxID=649196 RepID=A0ABT7NP18_9SPHI|nr:phospho-sugar mutase [Sphingobacterium hotanense]MDM1048992.1 phospho-sugar mutase [Sphingobacterium hotanense]
MGNLDKDTQARINQWLTNEYDQDTVAQVQKLVDNNEETELLDSFYKELEFGTGGLRGIMGVGSNRMNKYTIGKATQGLANYLLKQFPNQDIKVAVSYDSRNNSQAFGNLVADVFSANGIHVYLFEELRPTPVLSFAVRHFECQGGVMLTASHNPKEYNGYKAYWNDGGQLVAPHDKNVITEVNAIQSVNDIKFDRVEKNITLVGSEFDDIYIAENKKLSIHPEAVQAQKDLKIVYSPIHGTGITVVPKMLKAWGFENVTIVEEQAEPNGNFPTVIYPNPEEDDAMAKAKQKGQELDADVVMATDPDADRVGVAIKTPSGSFQLINGNQIGSLLTYYVLSSKKALGQLKPNDYIVKTIVTSNLFAAIADAHNVKYYETLTGFKYIGEVMTKLLGKENYLVGGEESYGYLVGDLVRDKDAVNSCAFIAEMCAYFKNQGKSLYDVLVQLYLEYGFYKEKLISLTKKGKAGADEIKQMMADLRAELPKTLGGIEVVEVRDYENSETTNMKTGEKSKIELPKSDVLQFITVDGDVISARPSGTEPKIKFYCSVKEKLAFSSEYGQISNRLDDKVEVMMADIIKD